MDITKRVHITRYAIGIFAMQVCAVEDATDKEILEACNLENSSGTTGGWKTVVRDEYCDGSGLGREENKKPVPCDDYKGRKHFLVYC